MRVGRCGKLKKRIISILLLLVMVIGTSFPAAAMDDDEYDGYRADTLTIKVGYFGGPYYEKKVFTVDDLWKMDVVYGDYTFIDNMPDVVIDHVAGVRLADIVEAAGIDINSVETFHFWTVDKTGDYYTAYSKTELIDTPRYCYYSLPDNFDEESGQGNDYAASDAENVDTLIALADDWNRCIAGATFGSDYLNLNTNTRFRLIFGQTNTWEKTSWRSAKWIHEIDVVLGGAPTVTLDASSLDGKVGSVLRTQASVSADEAMKASESVKWTSSDESIATVDEDGNITVKSEGTAVITATFGSASASVTVNGTAGDNPSGQPSGGTGTEESTPLPQSSGGGTEETGENKAESTPDAAEPAEKENAAEADETPHESSSPGEFQILKPAVDSASDEGGVQNWRTYEMSEDAEAMPNVTQDNPLLGFTGIIAVLIFVVSAVLYIIIFYKSIGRKKYVHKPKSQ